MPNSDLAPANLTLNGVYHSQEFKPNMGKNWTRSSKMDARIGNKQYADSRPKTICKE